jgi:serine/threonine protein kinase
MENIGRYKVSGELGRGAMGIVYRAMDPSIGRTVAIKTIRLSDLADPAERARLRERLFREAQSAGLLSHPGIVTIYDVAEEGETAYIAMEFVDGATLEHLMVHEPLDKQMILDVLRQTAAALDYAHKRGIIHRDIKPANIMLHERSQAKITDFGVAKIQSQQMTQSGAMMGTPNYMSPEQIQGSEVDGRADQFSLAVIAYELMTGEKPFAAESMPTLLFKIVKEAPVAPQRLNPSLGWPVNTVLNRALSKSAGDRYPTCSDFITALENACNASKGWTPLAPGTSQALPTVMEAQAPEVRDERPAAAAVVAQTPPTEEHVPKPLRWARTLAIIIISAGVVSAAMAIALNYFNHHDDSALIAQLDAPAPKEQTTPRPSPLSPPPEQPAPKGPDVKPPQLPGDKPLEEQTVPTEPAKNVPAADQAVRLVSNPPGAAITLDNRPDLTCKTPCSLSLPTGRHTLAATLDGHRRALRIFELPRDAEVFVNMDPTTGTLMIRSEPSGAAITINGQQRSEKTPAALTLPTGHYRIEIAKEGMKKDVEEVDIKDSVITNIDVNWASRNPTQ